MRQPRTWVVLGGLTFLTVLLLKLDVDKRVVSAVVLLMGLLTQAFTIILGLIALIPLVGPVLVGLLSLPLFWILKGTGNVLTILAVRQGYAKDVARSKLIVFVLTLGLVIGFLIGYFSRGI